MQQFFSLHFSSFLSIEMHVQTFFFIVSFRLWFIHFFYCSFANGLCSFLRFCLSLFWTDSYLNWLLKLCIFFFWIKIIFHCFHAVYRYMPSSYQRIAFIYLEVDQKWKFISHKFKKHKILKFLIICYCFLIIASNLIVQWKNVFRFQFSCEFKQSKCPRQNKKVNDFFFWFCRFE